VAARWHGPKTRGREEGMQARPCGVRREQKAALARQSVARGGQQRLPAIECERRLCRANRGGRRPWATWANVADERDWGEA
jgi:hypothetical protein